MSNKNLSQNQRQHGLHPWSGLRNEMMDFFDRFSFDNFDQIEDGKFMPKIDVQDKDNAFEVRAEIPGMSEKDINVSLQENQLVIEGEKKNETVRDEKGFHQSEISYGRFYRSIPLLEEVDPEKVQATYKDGVLCVKLEKRPETQKKSRKIEIKNDSAKVADKKH
jgi:HSP20 family protein